MKRIYTNKNHTSEICTRAEHAKRKYTKRICTAKLSVLLLTTLLMTFTLTGCMPDFDASGYIQACLDANTKGEFETYAELTGSSVAEVEDLYEQTINNEMTYINATDMSDERKEEFRTFYIDMYKSFKYEVGEATLNEDDSYTVPVTTYKLLIYEGIVENGEAHLTEYTENEMAAGNTPTQAQLEEEALNYMYDSMRSNLDALNYAEPVTTDITVTPEKKKSRIIYSINQSDLQTIMESLIDVDKLQ